MQLKKISGIILNIRPHKEFDKIISVFSHEQGRVRVIAKGVRRIKSHRGFHIDLFNHVKMETEEYGTGAAKTRYLREISTNKHFSRIKSNPPAFAAACLVASFLEKTLQENAPQKTLLSISQKCFESLDSGKTPKEILLNYFLKAMQNLGYLPKVIKKQKMRSVLFQTLLNLDSQFTLNARRTLDTFSSLESKISS